MPPRCQYTLYRFRCLLTGNADGDGLGMLNNELYRGAVIWNRSRWVRGAVDSRKRRQVVNPRRDWVEYRSERLRIVSDELWERAKRRQHDRARRVGERIKTGMNTARAGRTGRLGAYLFSGLLRCATCGSSYVIADRAHYACASRVNGGASACGENARLHRLRIEAGLLAGIKAHLSAPEPRTRVL
jgi:site-specific DNA recombinase